jgi:acyl-CoA reductase-like NAD-dependent aldehyde dehydrogenase
MNTTLTVLSPWNRQVLATLDLTPADRIEAALDRATALHRRPEGPLPLAERIAVLQRTAALVRERREEYALCAAREGGKPLVDSRVELDRAVQGIEAAIGEMQHSQGRVIPMGLGPSSAGRLALTLREPIGPVLAISAFNHPFNLIVHQAITAVAAGCPVLVKPAPATPLSAINLLACLQEAGLPEGWCSLVLCDNETTARLATDPRLSLVSFIGSARVGWQLRSRLAPGTRCVLEHGGVAPVVVFDDAPLDHAVPPVAKGGLYHAGQVCVSVQRVFAQTRIAEELAQRLTRSAEGQHTGDPSLADTEIGPLIRPAEVQRVHEWVEEARAGGARVLCGGHPLGETCYAPTILLDPPPDCRIMEQEVFGPVIAISRFEQAEQAYQQANRLPFAFQAAVFTRDLDLALASAHRLKGTTVMVNDHTAFRVDWMPFGGRELSGLGMGGIPETIRDLSVEKLVVFRSPGIRG